MRTQLALFLLLAVILVGCHASTPAEGSDAISLIITLEKQGRHDEAIRVAQDWMKKHPEESAHKKTDVDIALYETGRGFETAGDLSTTNRCLYYERAARAFEEEIPFIQGDGYTAYGKTIPLEPVRQEDEKALERVKVKLDKAGCK
jgi:hypothetical protein